MLTCIFSSHPIRASLVELGSDPPPEEPASLPRPHSAAGATVLLKRHTALSGGFEGRMESLLIY